MKKIFATLALTAMSVAGLTAISQPASAVTPTSNLYALNIANQNTGSGAQGFTELDGKTYYAASTLAHGTALWSVDGDSAHMPELVFDPFEGPDSGRITGIWGYDHYLFFWVQDTMHYSGLGAYVYDTSTKVVHVLNESTSGEQVKNQNNGYFDETNGEIYGLTTLATYSARHIMHFNKTDYTLEDLGETPFAATDGASNGQVESPWYTASSIAAVGSYLYVYSNTGNWPFDRARLYRYDLTTSTWSDQLNFANGNLIDHLRVEGKYSYAGETGWIFSVANTAVMSWYEQLSNFSYYFAKPDGTFVPLGTWTNSSSQVGFFNLKGSLYAAADQGANVYLIDPVTGERTSVLNTMFPGEPVGKMYIRSSKTFDDYFVFEAKLDNTAQYNPLLMYKWDGVGAAEQFNSVQPVVGQSSVNDSYSNSNSGASWEIGRIGSRAIINLNLDPNIGAEPYYLDMDGTLTLIKNMNVASDGSAPDTSCFITTPTGDWMTANVPLQVAGGQGKSVIVSMKPVGTFLQYSVIDPGNVHSPCGFTYIGDDIYFQGYNVDNNNWTFNLYKRAPDGTTTLVAPLQNANSGPKAFSYGGNYYWLGYNHYHKDLYEYDVANNLVKKLSGDWGVSTIGYDAVDNYVLSGHTLYLQANRQSGGMAIWAANLDEAEFSPVIISDGLIDVSSNGDYWNVSNLYDFHGRVLFVGTDSNWWNGRFAHQYLYEVDLTTNTATQLLEIAPGVRNVSVNSMVTVGNKIYFSVWNSDNNSYELRVWKGDSSVAQLPLPGGFQLNCIAPTGPDLIVQDQEGKAYYYGNGLNLKPIDYDFSGNTSAFCDAAATTHGTYLALPEYPYDNNGIGFGTEPGYIGPLTPIAVSRLGEPVTEAPAVPLSSTPPSEIPPAAPGAPGNLVATSAPGKVVLNWDAPSTGDAVATYIVESTPDGAQCQITGTSAQCVGLDPNTSYTFVVTATNAGGMTSSQASNAASPGAGLTAPGSPGQPVGTGIDGGATLSWTAPTDGGAVDSYVVISNPAGANCVVTGTNATCTGLNNYDSYTFTVVAVNDIDTAFSQASTSVLIGDPSQMPPADPTLVITPGMNSMTVTATAQPGGGTPTYYRVRLFSDWGDEFDCTITAPDTSCVITGLDYQQGYYADARAYNDNGRSSWVDSNYAYPIEPVAPGIPGAPTLTVGAHSVTATISAPTDGGTPDSYVVTLSPGGANCTVVAPATSCDITGLDPAVSYSATAVAVNVAGTSDASASSDPVTPLIAAPGKPGATTVVAGNGKVTVTPSAGVDGDAATSYTITATPGGASCTVTLPDTSCDITGLANGTAYTFTTTATNAAGTSVASDPTAPSTPINPNVDRAPADTDGNLAPKAIDSTGTYSATNDSTIRLNWDKSTGHLLAEVKGTYSGYIDATVSFTAGGKQYSCNAVFGITKAAKVSKLTRKNAAAVAAQKAAALAEKTVVSKSFCTDRIKLNPAKVNPTGGLTKENFVLIKPMNKSAAELKAEKKAAVALRGFTGQVDLSVVRYRAWPTTMYNVSGFDGLGDKLPVTTRNTSVILN